VINRYEAGIEQAAEIPLRALNTRNEYLSVMNEMMRLSTASASDPQQNTGLAELEGRQRSILFSPSSWLTISQRLDPKTEGKQRM
jgi:hypothetical protein